MNKPLTTKNKSTDYKRKANTMVINSNYFYGNEVSDYGKQNGYVDYRTLAKSFDAVLNNNIINETDGIGYWEIESGYVDNSDAISELIDLSCDLNEELETADDETEVKRLKAEIEEVQAQIDELEEEENDLEVFQWYIVSDNGAEILKECNEIVYYNDVLDMYLWGVTHYGTSWAYVLTNIKIELD